MSKKERQKELKKMLALVDEVDKEFIENAVNEFEVSEQTIKNDIKDILDSIDSDLPTPNNGVVVDTNKGEETELPKGVAAIYKLEPDPNPEKAKKRVVEYKVEKGSETLMHVELERVEFSTRTGKKTSIPVVQTFPSETWVETKWQLEMQGYNYINVIHDPRPERAKKEQKQIEAKRAKKQISAREGKVLNE